MKRLLIDDMRNDLHVGKPLDMIVRNYEMAILALKMRHWDEVYLDHDLGIDKSGYDVICWIEEYMSEEGVRPGKIICVSDNAPGRARIELAVRKIYGTL